MNWEVTLFGWHATIFGAWLMGVAALAASVVLLKLLFGAAHTD